MSIDVVARPEKWPRYYRLAKEASWLVIGQVVSVLGSLALVRVLAEYLNPTQYGELALGLTVAGLINQVITGGIQNAIGRFYAISVEKKDIYGYLRASGQLMFYASVAIGLIGLLLVACFFCLGYAQWVALTLVILIFSLLTSYKTAITGIQNAARQRSVGALIGALDNLVRIGLVFYVLHWFGASTMQVLISYILSSALILLLQVIFLQRLFTHPHLLAKSDSENSYAWLREMWTFSWPFSTWGIFGWIQQSAPRLALESFATTADVGYFSILSQLGYAPIQMAISFTISFLTPILFARVGDATCLTRTNNALILTRKLVLLGLMLTGLLAILMIFLHPVVFQLFATEEYAFVSIYLPWVVLSGGIFAVAQIYAAQLMALMVPKTMIAASIGSSMVGTLASYIGTWFFSLQGAVAGLLIHAITYFVWIVLAVRVSPREAKR